MNPASLLVLPDDRHFESWNAEIVRREQELNVPGEAVDRQFMENAPRRVFVDQLEAALSIPERKGRQHTNGHVEALPEELPPPALVEKDLAAFRIPRPDRDSGPVFRRAAALLHRSG